MAEILQLVQEFVTWWNTIPAWVGTVLVLYGFLLVAKLFGMPLGPITIIVAPLFIIPYLIIGEGNYPLTIKVLLSLLQFVTGLCFLLVKKIENDLLQGRRDRSAEAIEEKLVQASAQGKVPVYSVYLRPFAVTNRLATQRIEVSPGIMLMTGTAPAHIDFETLLQSALQPREQLIALGRPGEMLGAGRIASLETTWQTEIDILAEHAHSILLIPSNHAGTLWEINQIQEKHWLPKTIWIMPATIDDQLMPEGASAWAKAAQALKDIGIELPPYEEDGLLFMIDQQGRVCTSLPMGFASSLSRVRRMRKDLSLLQNPDRRAELQPHSRQEKKYVLLLKSLLIPYLIGGVVFGSTFYQAFHEGNLLYALFIIVFGIFWFYMWFKKAAQQ